MKKILKKASNNKVMSLKDINRAVEANYTGDDYANYNGVQQVSSAQLKSMQAASQAKAYRFSITNALASEQTIILTPGLNYDSTDPATGVIRTETTTAYESTTTGSAFTSSASAGSLETFLNFIRLNPVRLVGVKIASTVASQITDGVLTVATQSPFKSQDAEEQIYLSTYTDENRNQEKEVTAPIVLNLDNQKQIKMTVAASSTVTVTFFIGQITNIAAEAAKV